MSQLIPLQIVEIIKIAAQGKTKPFLCRGEDEQLYYVKGRTAGLRGQFCEWIVAHLAQAFGLPIPPYRIVEVPSELLAEGSDEYQILGSGLAFASLAKTQTQWFEGSFVSEVPADLRRAVIAFDWWVKNSDRVFDNPNMLWSPAEKQLVVIDHAFAFDDEFWPTIFLQYHVFKDDWESITGNFTVKQELQEKMERALLKWDEALDNAPSSWKDATGVTGNELFDCASALEILSRCNKDELWTIV